MARKKKRRRAQSAMADVGAPPGSLPPDGASSGPWPAIRVYEYGPGETREATLGGAAELRGLERRLPVTWIDVDGVGHPGTVRALGEVFGLHPLALEDVLHLRQRPKVEDYGRFLYVVLRMPSLVDGQLALEQVSLFLLPGVVVTLQERPGDCLDPLRRRILSGSGRVRVAGADYLAYALIDTIVDHYYPIAEQYGDRLEEIEVRLLQSGGDGVDAEIHEIRQDLHALRRSLWPLRETLGSLARGEGAHFEAETRNYLRDCHDHAAQLADIIEACRELSASLLDIHFSTLSQRMNEVMKLLTLIATIFMPLSFVASLYGMNFDRSSPWNMPELGWAFGYPFAVGVMAATALGFLVFFRRKGWLGRRRERGD